MNKNGSIIVKLDKALYGCIESAKLFYDHISNVLLNYKFVKNAYDQCVFNKKINGAQCSITIHVDDLMISCANLAAIEDILSELRRVYKVINAHRDKCLDYLGMIFDYSVDGQVKISMEKMVEELLQEYSVEGTVKTPAASFLFKVGKNIENLKLKEKELFHSIVAKLLYMSKRARPDILTTVSFLSTRVCNPTVEDMKKLARVLQYLNGTKELCLFLTTNKKEMVINSYIDSAYGNHDNGMGHTGTVISLGGGAVFCKSSKQKLVARSSTEAELIGLSDGAPQVLWTRNFLIEQGYKVNEANIYQDNISTITLIEKGRSTSNRTRHISMRYFFLHDRIQSKELKITYKNTTEMLADFFTKALQGRLFFRLRREIMNLPESYKEKELDE